MEQEGKRERWSSVARSKTSRWKIVEPFRMKGPGAATQVCRGACQQFALNFCLSTTVQASAYLGIPLWLNLSFTFMISLFALSNN